MQNRIKLLYITHAIEIGGVETALISAVPKLFEKYDLTVVVLGKVSRKMVEHLTIPQQACFHSFDYPLWATPLAILKVQTFISRVKPDVLISSLWRASMMGAIAKRRLPGIRFVSFIHSNTFFHKLDEYFTRMAVKNADCIFADSHASAEFIRLIDAPKSDIKIISFFTRLSPAYPNNPKLNSEQIKFMFLGRLSKVKNLDIAVDMIAHLQSKGINATLNVYGPDEGLWQSLSAKIKSGGLQEAIRYHGKILGEQKTDVFKQHQFLVQLSSHEGMAMSVIEAMQNGLVCFVTPVGEIKHYATDMENAVFANIENVHGWNESLDKIVRCIERPDVYENVSRNAFERFKNVELYADSITTAIEDIVSGSFAEV